MKPQNFIIFDTEYASWEGFLKAPEAEKKKAEIVQIAALKVNVSDLSVVEEFNVFIKPHFTPRLTDYFIRLTGLTDQLLAEKGISFPEAYNKFKSFAGDCHCYSHGWSLSNLDIADGRVMGYNLAMFDITDEAAPDYKNIAPWFQKQYALRNINISKQCSGEIATLLNCTENLPDGLDIHNALYDVYSILAGLKKLGFNENDFIS